MEQPLLRFENLRKSFGSQVVLDGVTLDIPRYAITAIIGKSGTGKSVLVKHAVGLLQPDAGEIYLDGQPYSRMERHQKRAMKRRFSYMFQNNALFDSLTVFENVELPLKERGEGTARERAARVHEVCAQLELTAALDQFPKALSGGMQKRVALARALVGRPEAIFFDEPTTGLDPLRKNAVLTLVAQKHAQMGFTAVIITHDVPDIFYVAHHVHILDGGRVVFSGSPLDLERQRSTALRPYLDGRGILTDILAGLGGREDYVAAARKRAAQGPGWILGIRLCGLRQVRDYQGHVTAFETLRHVAQALQKTPLAHEGLWRLGPETLACLPAEDLSNEEAIIAATADALRTCPASAALKGQRLRLEVGAAPLDPSVHPLQLVHTALTQGRGVA